MQPFIARLALHHHLIWYVGHVADTPSALVRSGAVLGRRGEYAKISATVGRQTRAVVRGEWIELVGLFRDRVESGDVYRSL